MIRYYKLFDLINRREMKKTDLLEIISAPTLAKLSKGDTIKTDIIDKICEYLNCQPEDIMEYVPNAKRQKDEEPSLFEENVIDEVCEMYAIYNDLITRDEIIELMKKCRTNKTTINQDKLTKLVKDLHYKKSCCL